MRHADVAPLGVSGYPRATYDRYWTEPRATEALLKYLSLDGDVWEPAVGRGDMAAVLRGATPPYHRLWLSDIDLSDLEQWRFAEPERSCSTMEADFLADLIKMPDPVRFIVTNPPNKWATFFVRRAIDLMERVGGTVAMLMPNEFDCTEVKDDKGRLFDSPYFRRKIILRPGAGASRLRWDDWRSGQPIKAPPRRNYSWYIWTCSDRPFGGARVNYHTLPEAKYG